MAARLKVFRSHIGFYETVVAVPVASTGEKAIQKELDVTIKAVFTQLASVVVMAVLDAAVAKYRKRVDQRISLQLHGIRGLRATARGARKPTLRISRR